MFPPHQPSPYLTPELQEAEKRFHEQLAVDPEGAIAKYQERFGNIIDRDNVRELFDDYAASRESRQALGAATYRPAGMLTDEIFRREITKPDPKGENLVIFNAGGPGVGKSMGVSGLANDAQLVMDGTLSNYEKSRKYIQTALDNDKAVGLNFTQRPFEEALENIITRAADEANGRVVSAPMAAQGRILARENLIRLAEEHADNPHLGVSLTDVAGNEPRDMTLDELRQQEPETLDDLKPRAQSFINAYFRDHSADNPAFTEGLRRRVLGTYADGEGGGLPREGNGEPPEGGTSGGGSESPPGSGEGRAS